MRVIDLGAGDEQKVLLDRLRQVWPSLGKDGNKLIIDVPEKKAAPAQDESKPGQTTPKTPRRLPRDGSVGPTKTTSRPVRRRPKSNAPPA